ncbi:MAG: hypothetical protein EOS59_32685 [Mesorhizobium sp.]|nr:MAG: hypothetical protein EOS59_32685 [Mesorhizobium sp.]
MARSEPEGDGDYLGHRSAFATRTYARVDLAGLRQVGAFDLGGLAMTRSSRAVRSKVSPAAR